MSNFIHGFMCGYLRKSAADMTARSWTNEIPTAGGAANAKAPVKTSLAAPAAAGTAIAAPKSPEINRNDWYAGDLAAAQRRLAAARARKVNPAPAAPTT